MTRPAESVELIFEVAPREDTRSPVRGRPAGRWPTVLWLLPAGALVGVVLLAPLLVTLVESLTAGPEAVGFGHYQTVLGDQRVRHAVGNSLAWLAVAPLVCLAGLVLAWLGLRNRQRFPALLMAMVAAPVAFSPLVVGVIFRLLFDPEPGRGTVNAAIGLVRDGEAIPFLGPGWIWLVLAAAFSWQWIGLAIVVFEAGIVGVPTGLLRVTRAFGAGRLRRLWTVQAPALIPVAALALLIVLVAAARLFELVLVAAPGSMQDEVEVAGLHWWRSGRDFGDGGSAALAALLFVVVGLAALGVLWGLSRPWPVTHPSELLAQPARPQPGRWPVRLLGLLAVAVWAVPLVVLVLTSLRDPKSAAGSGWWTGGWGLESYAGAFASGELLDALADTGIRATFAAVLLLAVAVPAAHVLAWGGLSRTAVRALVAVAAVLAVTPPQVVAGPLSGMFDQFRLLGASTTLTVVHAGFGVPLAVLLLRNAFASVPGEVVRRRRLERVRGSVLLAVVVERWPTLVTVAVLEFVLVWNDLVVGLFLGGPVAGQVTLVLLEQARQFTTSSGVLAAGAVVITAVPLALVLATGRWLVRGLFGGAR